MTGLQYNVYTVGFDATGRATGPIRRLNPAGYFIQPMINRAGSQVVFWGRERGETGFNIWRYDVATTALRKLTDGRAVNGHPFWSGDSRRILFFSTEGLTGETEWSMATQFTLGRSPRNLWIMDAEGGDRRRLTTGTFVDERPCITPDGRSVVFVSNRSGAMNLWLVNVAGGEPRQLTRHAGLDYRPVFSPRGDQLAFFSTNHPRGTHDLCVMEWPDGPARFPVAPGQFDWIHGPFWLPDGKSLLIHALAAGPPKRMSFWRFWLADGRLEPLVIPGASGFAHGSIDSRQTVLAFDSAESF